MMSSPIYWLVKLRMEQTNKPTNLQIKEEEKRRQTDVPCINRYVSALFTTSFCHLQACNRTPWFHDFIQRLTEYTLLFLFLFSLFSQIIIIDTYLNFQAPQLLHHWYRWTLTLNFAKLSAAVPDSYLLMEMRTEQIFAHYICHIYCIVISTRLLWAWDWPWALSYVLLSNENKFCPFLKFTIQKPWKKRGHTAPWQFKQGQWWMWECRRMTICSGYG